MATAAKKLLDSLSPEQMATLGFDFKAPERMNWHFIPKPRKGLTLKDMSEDQRALAKSLLSSGVSEKANNKIMTIMSLELILKDMEKGTGPRRDPEMYYWSVFGTPGGKSPWGWRVEGHHVSINFTVISDNEVVAAPVFLGDNPADVKEGPRKGLRVLAEEEDMGRAFVKSLSEEQFKKAQFLKTAPAEIITKADRQAVLQKFEGIPYNDLTHEQKLALFNLIRLYADRLRPNCQPMTSNTSPTPASTKSISAGPAAPTPASPTTTESTAPIFSSNTTTPRTTPTTSTRSGAISITTSAATSSKNITSRTTNSQTPPFCTL